MDVMTLGRQISGKWLFVVSALNLTGCCRDSAHPHGCLKHSTKRFHCFLPGDDRHRNLASALERWAAAVWHLVTRSGS